MADGCKHPHTDEVDFGQWRVVIHADHSEEKKRCSQRARNATEGADRVDQGVAVVQGQNYVKTYSSA